MTPRDYAVEIEPNASPERLFEVEKVIRRALADEACRLAQLIETADMKREIHFAGDAADYCRREAHEHLNHT